MDARAQNGVYTVMMVDSLKRKERILKIILSITEQQSDILKQEKLDADLFEELLGKKEKAIDELNDLDEGFDRLFKYVEKEIKTNRTLYRKEIQIMQQCISAVSELDASVRTIEAQNKERFKKILAREKDVIRNYHINSQLASNYHRNMANIHRAESSYFLNEKK